MRLWKLVHLGPINLWLALLWVLEARLFVGLGLGRMCRMLGSWGFLFPCRLEEGRREAVLELVDRVLDRRFTRRACLVQALILFEVYRRVGKAVELVFGVRNREGCIEGHCWVVVEGEPWGAGDFQPLLSIGSKS